MVIKIFYKTIIFLKYEIKYQDSMNMEIRYLPLTLGSVKSKNQISVFGSVAEWFEVPFSMRPGSQGFWFNPHPRHVVASLDKTLNDAYLCLVESKQAAN